MIDTKRVTVELVLEEELPVGGYDIEYTLEQATVIFKAWLKERLAEDYVGDVVSLDVKVEEVN